jgi:hypothetical protein
LQLTYSSVFSVSHEARLSVLDSPCKPRRVFNFLMKKFEPEVANVQFRLRQDCFVINFPVDFVNLNS